MCVKMCFCMCACMCFRSFKAIMVIRNPVNLLRSNEFVWLRGWVDTQQEEKQTCEKVEEAFFASYSALFFGILQLLLFVWIIQLGERPLWYDTCCWRNNWLSCFRLSLNYNREEIVVFMLYKRWPLSCYDLQRFPNDLLISNLSLERFL